MKGTICTHKFAITLIVILLCQIGHAAVVEGLIKSEAGPIEFVVVHSPELGHSVVSDSSGNFRLESFIPGSYTIIFSIVGFQKNTFFVKIKTPNETVRLDVTMVSNVSLKEVVITGTMKEVSLSDSPVPIELYQASFFKANPNPSVFESLQNVNGVRPQLNCNVCSTGDIHINGLEGPYTFILIDGMPIVSGLSSVYGMTGIPQSMVERIEIVKGPASALYGSEAMGGLINVITKDADNMPKFSMDLQTTSWKETNMDFMWAMKSKKRFDLLLALNAFSYDSPRDMNGDGFTDVTLQKRISVFNKWSFKRTAGRKLSFAARWMSENRWGGQMNWNESFRGSDLVYGESIVTNRYEMIGAYELPFQESIVLQFSLNGHQQDSYYGITQFEANQQIGFAQLVWDREIKTHEMLAGLALRYTLYDDNTPATEVYEERGVLHNSVNRTLLPGVFVQDIISLSPSLKLLTGLRYDYQKIYGHIATPRMNLKWESQDTRTIIRIGSGNGFRIASVFTEDHAALTGAREVVFTETLNPERSWNTNFNVVHKRALTPKTFATLDLSLFYTHFSNKIIPDYESNPNQIIYDNLKGFAVSKGVTANLDIAIGSNWRVLTGATWMDVSITENNEAIRQMLTENFSAVWTLSHETSNKKWKWDYTGNLYAPMRLPLLGPLDNRPEYSPWWSIQNIQMTYRPTKTWEVYGGVKNLLNYTPPANSIARSFDPFDKDVTFDSEGQALATTNNPNALTFDPTYVFAPNQGVRFFLGVRFFMQ